MPVGLALAAALVYGAADFFGGIASRRNPATVVVLLSQIVGAVVLACAILAAPVPLRSEDIRIGAFAGLAGAVAIVALYAALAVGRMSVVSPVTAVVGAAVPVVVSLVRGDRPAATAAVGIMCALVAIVLATMDPKTRRFSLAEPGLGLALLSGLAIGLLLILLAGPASAGFGRLGVTRVVSMTVLAAYCLIRREPLRPAAGTFWTIVAAGALDMSANIFYVLAAARGMLAIVAVLTSLYPAATVLLAGVVLRERLSPIQWTGVAAALAGVVLIAL